MTSAAAIRRRYYLLSGANTLAASLIWGVNTLFLLETGLDLLEVFGINAVFTAAMTIFEIPTGAVADSKGRRVSLQWSALMLFVGTVVYLVAGTWGGGFLAFSVASIILGLGFTFFSGAAEAWAVDELKAFGEEGSEVALFATAATMSSVMMLFGTVAGGLLGSIDYRVPYILRAVLFIVMLILSTFAMPEKGWQPDSKHFSPWERIRRTAVDSVKYGWQVRSLRHIMGFSLLLGSFMMWGFYALQPYITDLARFPGAAWLSGLVTAILALSQIGGQTLVAKSAKKNGKAGGRMSTAMILATLGALVAGLSGMPGIREILGHPGAALSALAGMMIMMGSLGYIVPLQQNALHSRVDSKKRATVISLNSLMGSGGAIVGQPLLGWVSRQWSISMGYIIGAGIFVLTQPLLAFFRKSEDSSDLS